MMNKLALGALLLVAFVLTSVVGVDAQKRVSTKTFDGGALEIVPEANEAANLDQCQNGAVGGAPVSCAPGWSNGNSNGNNSHYAEGLNIHYRIKFSNLVPDTNYVITLGYDTWQNTTDKNAIDFLNNYDATITPAGSYTVVPCDGTQTGCGAAPTTVLIPDDPCHGFDNLQPGRVFTGWGMTLTGSAYVSALDTPALCDVQERQLTVSFTANSTSPVLAWSGHIARAADWNSVNETSASSIQGSPYHMRIISNTGWGGQQDRSLATTAIVTPTAAPASITGRVTDYYGRGVYGAYVQLFDANTGTGKLAVTNSFGYYRFDDNPVGDFYVMSVSHKRYTFVNGSVSFTLEDNLSGMNFQASY